MKYLGDFANDSTIIIPWATVSTGGASITRATDGSIRVYKNDSTAEKTTANGITDNEDFDTMTGVHLIKIDTSNDTGDAGFWATGNDYFVVVVGAVIDGQTVNYPIGHFSIENRFMRGTDSANTTTPLTAAQVNAEVDTALADYDPPTKAEMDAGFAALNDLSAAQVNAEVDTALADYDAPTKSEMDSAFAALNDVSAAVVNSQVDIALADYDAPTKAEMDAGFAALNDLSAAQVNAEADTALADLGLDLLIANSADPVDVVDNSLWARMHSKAATADYSTFNNTTDSLEAITDSGGGGLTEQQVRDAMKLAPSAGSPAAGSIDDHLDDLVAATPSAGAIEVTDIVVDDGTNPVEGAEVWISTDTGGTNVVWKGVTESNGNPKDNANNNPWLDAGTYYLWVQHGAYTPPSLPITKVVS